MSISTSAPVTIILRPFQKFAAFREKYSVDPRDPHAVRPVLNHWRDFDVMLEKMAVVYFVIVYSLLFFHKPLIEALEYPLIAAGIRDKVIFYSRGSCMCPFP